MPSFLYLKTYKGKQNQTFSIYIVMIQWTYDTGQYLAYLSTEDNRISIGSTKAQLAYLVKFINDMDGSVQYSYANTVVADIQDRYTKMEFYHHAAVGRDIYAGDVHFTPQGHYKYEVYEISWTGASVVIDEGTAPATELDVLTPKGATKGIVQGLVTKGILNVTEKSGDEQVQYVQKAKSVQTLTISYGGAGYTSPPTIAIIGDNITQATATCTISGGVVNTVTITNAGSGYTTNPTVTLSASGATAGALISANIEQTNYIFYGQ